ncbi:MAG TPA: arylsulfatase [Gemmataceae bacterium]|jgi:arylsulfatase
MFRTARLQLVAVLAIGGIGGWLAGSGRLQSPTHAQTSAPPPAEAAAPRPGCCGEADRGLLLAKADNPLPGSGGGAGQRTGDGKKPNILVIWGDDIGQSNLSVYSHGVMGYKTPNIDRLAREGMMFTDYYAEQSCTAGRAAFIMGQSVFRSGLSKVGLPGAALGMRAEDPTIAEMLKPLGYATGQFGKNHLGDKDEHLPTMHGFDEFYGNLYHLNAEEEPELRDYPKDPEFKKKYGPRGVLKCKANADGTQTIENTGPLTKKRMETCDTDFADSAIDFIKRQNAAGKPFFCWVNTTHMHLRTHERPEDKGRAGRWQSEYHDAMLYHDECVGKVLAVLDELKIADDTFVMYSTDNGPHMNTWPDGGMTPFRNEKNSNWEGAFRVPCIVRWPGHVKAGTISNEIVSHLDWLPTFAAMAGDTEVTAKLLKGYSVETPRKKTFKVHLDGYNLVPYLTGQAKESPRKEFFYFSDDGDLMGLRYDNWKAVFAQQRAPGTMLVWGEPFVKTRLPWLYNLRTDPYERATITSNTYWDWYFDHVYLLVPMQEYVGKYLATFKEYPPRQKAASFTIDQVMEQLQEGLSGGK